MSQAEVMKSIGGQLGPWVWDMRVLWLWKITVMYITDICWWVWSITCTSPHWLHCKISLNLLYFRDELYAHVCNIHSFLPRPFYLSSHLSFFFLPCRQNPVPEESCSRRGHEAAAFHRRLLQGKFKHPSSICLWGMSPACGRGSKVVAYIVLSHALNMGHVEWTQL